MECAKAQWHTPEPSSGEASSAATAAAAAEDAAARGACSDPAEELPLV
jgi:hypothetical protein